MKNFTQTLKRNYLAYLFLLFFSTTFGQNGIIGTGFGTNNWSTTDTFLPGAGSSRIFTATPNGTGNQYFRLVRNWSSDFTQFGPFGCLDTDWTNPEIVYGMSDCGSGEFYINCPNITDNYVFKTPNGNVSKDLLYFRIQGAVRSVSNVTQFPLAASAKECHKTSVSATLTGALATGQAVYLRYTKDGYATSTIVPMTGSETTYIGTIPAAFNTDGANVSYYVFTSGTSTPSSADADLYTLNLNNNAGFNYAYKVAAGGATTAIPDAAFEQVIIDLGLDCTIDGQVFTSNITGVTLLDIRDRSIISLVGIKDFTNLDKLYCNNEIVGDLNDNAITDLDVSGLANLRYFYCQNNLITNLNISGLTSLEALDTSNNLFSSSSLDVHLFHNLFYLVCQNNGLTSLNISGLTNLQTLIVWDNNLVALDVSTNPDLKYLDCDENEFTSINLNGLTRLESFYCSKNALTTIDVSESNNLIDFNCNDNLLNDLDIRGLTNLDFFDCSNNPLTCILVGNVEVASAKTKLGNWVKDAIDTYSYCNCSLTTTWTSTFGGSWSDGPPTAGTYAAIISADYNQSADINACTLTINNNAIVTIPSGFNVRLNAPLTVVSGSSFTLSNNANLVQTNKQTVNSGNITVNRNSNSLSRLDYTLWSSPVVSQNLLAFSPATTTTRFYNYDTAFGTNGAFSPIANPSVTPFAVGAGYLIRMPNTAVDAPSIETFNGQFTGVPYNGDVLVTLSYVDASRSYNLVGNPYASTIDANKLISDNSTNIESTLYFWRKTNGSGSAYAAYNPAGGVLTYPSTASVTSNGTIQVGQGFFVQAKSAGPIANFFTNAMRLGTSSTQFFKTKQLALKDRIWLNLTSATGVFSQALVAYIANATQGIDIYDGKYINDSPIALTSNINNEEYTIQGRPAFNASDVVSLNFKTDVAGNYTIAIDHVDGLFSGGQDIYLLDRKTGTETNLKTSSYSFTSTAEVDNVRFSLKFQKTLKLDAPVFSNNSVTVYKNNETLYVYSAALAIANIKVFDIQGRLIAERKNMKANSATISNLKTAQQVLIVKVTGQDNTVVSKKIVN